MSGQELYELHRDSLDSFGLELPPWQSLEPETQARWIQTADEFVTKRLEDDADA